MVIPRFRRTVASITAKVQYPQLVARLLCTSLLHLLPCLIITSHLFSLSLIPFIQTMDENVRSQHY
jgi:hypothetical protein